VILKHHLLRGMLIGFILLLSGCGAKPSPPSSDVVQLYVRLTDTSRLSSLPLTLASKLGFFQSMHLNVTLTSSSSASLSLGFLPHSRTIIGYLTTRPDLVLVSPIADPHFRLRALNRLPLVYSHRVQEQISLAHAILKAHRANISTWSSLSFQEIRTLWKRHHLPWVLVTLHQATILTSLDPHSVILAWLGASTGPLPDLVISASPNTSPANAVRFLKAVNLALWYLHTTPPTTIATVLDGSHQRSVWRLTIQKALHYQYWPVTSYPDNVTYQRGRSFDPTWPPYSIAVNNQPGHQALSETDK